MRKSAYIGAGKKLSLVLARILRSGGFSTGGFNFDAKIRRQSIDPQDLFHAHVGGIDTLARALLMADRILSDGVLQKHLDARYGAWSEGMGREILSGKLTLAQLSDRVLSLGLDPKPTSGRQEMLENLLSQYL